MNRDAPVAQNAIGIPGLSREDGIDAGWTVNMVRRGEPGRPWLVWLHGLLGSGDDWAPVLPYFSGWSLVTLNLPGHGRPASHDEASPARRDGAAERALYRESAADAGPPIQTADAGPPIQAADAGSPVQTAGLDFARVSAGLTHTLAVLGITRYILVGYSLGGRIALYHACRGQSAPRHNVCAAGAARLDASQSANGPQGLRGVFVEGAHPGLVSREERDDRLRHDGNWAQRFRLESLPAVLADWYRQPVFADLSAAARRELVALRAGNDGAAIAGMLQATSLARQPDLAARLRALGLPFGYLCGEHDAKFAALARRARLPFFLVPGAGHNAHRANPPAYAGQLLALLAPFY